MKERIFILDTLRAVAILGVVAIHTTGSFIRLDPPFEGLYIFLGNISKFSVALFFVLSAFLLYQKYNASIDTLTFYKNRLSKILIPYFIFSLVYEIYRLTDLAPLYFQRDFHSLSHFIKIFTEHLLKGGSYFHLYFMSAIITFYLIFPPLLKLYKKYPLLTLAALLMTQFGANFLWVVLKPPTAEKPGWMIVWWLIYIALGLFAARYLKFPFKKIKKSAVFYIFLIAGIAILYFLNFMSESQSLRLITPLTNRLISPWIFYFYSITTIVFLYLILLSIGDLVKTKTGKLVSILSAEAFGIYLVHPLINDLLFLNIIPKNNLDLSPFGFFIYYTIVVITSVFFYYPIKKFVSFF